MTTILTYQTAFGRGEIRPVDVRGVQPGRTDDELLAIVFARGQNECQPIADRYSLSVGDLIELREGAFYRVASLGFDRVGPRRARRIIAEAATSERPR